MRLGGVDEIESVVQILECEEIISYFKPHCFIELIDEFHIDEISQQLVTMCTQLPVSIKYLRQEECGGNYGYINSYEIFGADSFIHPIDEEQFGQRCFVCQLTDEVL